VKKIFILTGEASGDKLASEVIRELKKDYPEIEYLSVGGENLKTLGINSIYDLKEVTYIGFTNVIRNIFKINRKINETVKAIKDFEPDILFTVDSPDFTLRVAERFKKINSKVKTIHYVAPQVWVWREGRVKKIKKFIDHILLLFNFEKPFFDKESMSNEFVGHPLLNDSSETKIDINQIFEKNKALISVFPGSRISEIKILMPILLDFIKLMNKDYQDFIYIFHSTKQQYDLIQSYIKSQDINNCEIISDAKIKSHTLKKSVFAVAKSGTVSLEICKSKVPSVILYKMNFLNYIIIRSLVKVKFANIINIAAGKEVIPELLQTKCNPKDLFKIVSSFLDDPNKIKNQIEETQSIINRFKTNISPSKLASQALAKFL
tara:strand:+ start:291 stop:1421 length:1131 start_codon:yes stop_codon:yes gene_type:complete